jgi:hypothetical protein
MTQQNRRSGEGENDDKPMINQINLLGYFQTKDQSHTFENGMLMKIVIRQGVHD